MLRKVVKEDLGKSMWVNYPSAITEIAEMNSSFDSCMIRVMYTGKNRNKTSISKAAVERAIPTIYNVPIVCNYNVEEDSIGGHDVEIVKTDYGVKMVNLTDAIGVIPAGAEYHWEQIQDGDTTHEYLCVGGLLWKRSSAYDKIKRDGWEGQSMEISVENGQSVDGYYEINDFSFTALCILGDAVEPCFESAALETFSLELYKKTFSEMMEDLKYQYSKVIPASADDIHKDSLEGGEGKMNIDELMAKYGLSAEEIDFSMDEMTQEELEAKFAEISEAKASNKNGESEEPPAENTQEAAAGQEAYALSGEQFLRELVSALRSEMVYDECWECDVPRYWYIDYDAEQMEVYAEDRKDCRLYGMKYAVNGDAVTIDFATAKRKKIVFADFEGEVPDGGVAVFAAADEIAKAKFSALKGEIAELKQFKADVIAKKFEAEKEALFAKFGDLSGNQMFVELKENCADMTIEEIEEKCFAIRGRSAQVKFSTDDTHTPVRTPIEAPAQVSADEPYGGVFIKYGKR